MRSDRDSQPDSGRFYTVTGKLTHEISRCKSYCDFAGPKI